MHNYVAYSIRQHFNVQKSTKFQYLHVTYENDVKAKRSLKIQLSNKG